ncbi:hypothetical protein [Bradyrhizobium macuxiense]|uniref:hypothetical protein n=1 Tax=Bradyrhizobium macuxiense TaxID=1755647 RepID=UPI001FEE4F78|nr:hypothetical protein [Bradyrhizobium macuxiense]
MRLPTGTDVPSGVRCEYLNGRSSTTCSPSTLTMTGVSSSLFASLVPGTINSSPTDQFDGG